MRLWTRDAKYAFRHALPLTFIIEDNGLSTETPTRVAWGQEQVVPVAPLPNTVRYLYVRVFPHVGVGEWVNFQHK